MCRLKYKLPAAAEFCKPAASPTLAQSVLLKNIYQMAPGISDDGIYAVYPVFTTNKGVSSVKLGWFTISTGVQVVAGIDLSARSVRLLAVGN